MPDPKGEEGGGQSQQQHTGTRCRRVGPSSAGVKASCWAAVRKIHDGIARSPCRPWTTVAVVAASTVFLFVLISGVLVLGVKGPMEDVELARCEVISHKLLAWDTRGDGSPARYLPGLRVQFEAIDEGPDDGRPSAQTRAVARPTVAVDGSWMDQHSKNTFYARHPVGVSVDCFYKRDRWDFVAMSCERTALCLPWWLFASCSLMVAHFCVAAYHETSAKERSDDDRRAKKWHRRLWRCFLRTYAVCAVVLAYAIASYSHEAMTNKYGHPSILPDMAIAECNITSHEMASRLPTDPFSAMPKLGVSFREHVGFLNQPVVWHAQAHAHMIRSRAQMAPGREKMFFAQHPVGASVPCYYSRRDFDFVALDIDPGWAFTVRSLFVLVTCTTIFVSFLCLSLLTWSVWEDALDRL